MNELDLIRESLQTEIKNPQNYEKLVQQSASNIANMLILKPVLDTINRKIDELKHKKLLRKNHKKLMDSNLIELLRLLDDPNLNESNVILIQKLILLSLSAKHKAVDEILSREYIKIAKSLSGSEIVVLQAALERLKLGKLKENVDIDDVYKELAKLSGLGFFELIIGNYLTLVDKRLFKNPWDKEKTRISNTDSNYVFTELGLSFMNYLEEYKSI